MSSVAKVSARIYVADLSWGHEYCYIGAMGYALGYCHFQKLSARISEVICAPLWWHYVTQ